MSKLTFEKALSDLQNIVEELESESITLDKMIKLYENGVNLISYCHNELIEVEDRVKTIVESNEVVAGKYGDIK